MHKRQSNLTKSSTQLLDMFLSFTSIFTMTGLCIGTASIWILSNFGLATNFRNSVMFHGCVQLLQDWVNANSQHIAFVNFQTLINFCWFSLFVPLAFEMQDAALVEKFPQFTRLFWICHQNVYFRACLQVPNSQKRRYTTKYGLYCRFLLFDRCISTTVLHQRPKVSYMDHLPILSLLAKYSW